MWPVRRAGGRCISLTTLPPSYADCLAIGDPQTSETLRAWALCRNQQPGHEGSRFEGPVASHVNGREEIMTNCTSNFQNATELYSSQFVCCLSTSDWKKYTPALV